MELIKDKWEKSDIRDFNEYLKTFEIPSKVEWATKIINTKLPLLAVKTKDLVTIVKEINKGNFLSFLDLKIFDTYESIIINGELLCKIKDIETLKKYLYDYSLVVDNWAGCDCLSFNIKGQEEDFFKLGMQYIKSDKPFARRIGLNIIFCFVKLEEYVDQIFDILNQFYEEEEYYVNMMNAWILCECFIKHRDKTLEFIKDNKLNKFTQNKGIQKCRDSYRVTKEDKNLLLKYKK